MGQPELVPAPGQWVKMKLEEWKISNAAVSRAIGRSRTEVQRWVGGREQVPRVHLGQIARQFGNDADFRYAMGLKDVEDLGDQLKRYLNELAKRTSCRPEDLHDAVFSVVSARMADEMVPSARDYPDLASRYLADASFVFQQWATGARTRDFSTLLGPDTIRHHYRYPTNHFLGLALRLGEISSPGLLPELSAAALVQLRTLAQSRPRGGPAELVRHHAIHMLARNGVQDDRATVTDIISQATMSEDPLGRRLGYVGLILSSTDDEVMHQYLFQLRRDARLAKADLYFDAVHYGDAALGKGQHIPESIVTFNRSVANLLRHLEQPGRYASIAELDSLRLLRLAEIGDPGLFARPEIALRLRRIVEQWPTPEAGSYRRKLESRLFGAMSQHRARHPMGASPMGSTPEYGYDVFIGYHSGDLPQVRQVVDALLAAGVRTWFDRDDLPPGKLFQAEIEKVLGSCRSAALFVGATGIGPWENLEVRAAISQFVERGLPVIPVMLGAGGIMPSLPLFLREFRMVVLGHPTDIDELVWGVTGRRKARAVP